MKTLAIIPAYNEEESIINTLNALKNHNKEIDILVVNDGSRDKTSELSKKWGAKVIDHPYNLGGGVAVQTGIKYAYQYNYDYAFQFDADGQHNEKDVYKLLQPLINEEADFCIGSRFRHENSYKPSIVRIAGVSFFSALTSFLIDQKLTDVTSGFKSMNKKVMKICSEEYSADFPDVEVILNLKHHNIRITEIPTQMKERQFGQSYFNLKRKLYYPIRMIYMIMILVLRKTIG